NLARQDHLRDDARRAPDGAAHGEAAGREIPIRDELVPAPAPPPVPHAGDVDAQDDHVPLGRSVRDPWLEVPAEELARRETALRAGRIVEQPDRRDLLPELAVARPPP